MADMTIAFTVTGTMNGKKVSWSATATVADVDDVLTASADGISGDANFFTAISGSYDSSTMHSYTGMSAVLFVGGNQGGVNSFSMGGAATLQLVAPSGFPVAVYNGGGFNGMFNQGTTANDAPDEDPEFFAGGELNVGRVRYSALGALKAIS